MNTQGPRRGGGRRRGGRGPRRYEDRGERAERGPARPPQAPAKQSFWQKVVAFFTGGDKGKTNGASSQSAPARQYPKYEPRLQGEGSEMRSERPPREPREPRERREPRKPELVEVTSEKLYVGNLSFEAAESDLFELFNGVGNVRNAEIVTFKDTEKSKGFGFVTMATVDEAKRAVTELNDKEFLGRKLVVSGAKTPA